MLGRDTVGLNWDLETLSYIMCDGTSQEMISSPPTWIIMKLPSSPDDEAKLCSPHYNLPQLTDRAGHQLPGRVPEQDDQGPGWVDLSGTLISSDLPMKKSGPICIWSPEIVQSLFFMLGNWTFKTLKHLIDTFKRHLRSLWPKVWNVFILCNHAL